MADITIADVTDGTIAGAGAFDQFMVAITAHIKAEYDAGRINGKDYSTVYLGALQSALAQAVQFVLNEQISDKQGDKINAEIALINQKAATEEAQTLDTTTLGTTPGAVAGVVSKQKALIQQQSDGFLRDAEQKAARIMLDTFNVRRSTDALTEPPTRAEDEDINKFIETLAAGVNITLPDTYTVSGTLDNITGTGMIIQLNGGQNLNIEPGQTTFQFPIAIAAGAYSVTVFQDPSGQSTPTITNGTGTITDSNITNVDISYP